MCVFFIILKDLLNNAILLFVVVIRVVLCQCHYCAVLEGGKKKIGRRGTGRGREGESDRERQGLRRRERYRAREREREKEIKRERGGGGGGGVQKTTQTSKETTQKKIQKKT